MKQETRLIWLTAILMGAVIGLSVGHAGLESGVLAAVLPVIITGTVGGAAAVVLRFMSHIRKAAGLATVAVIAFLIAYAVGMYGGRILESRWSQSNVERLVTRYHGYVRRCTGQLKRLNAIRQSANEKALLALEPLTVDQVCIALPDGVPEEVPLVSLVGMRGFVLMSSKTETEHYKFLERCSITQSAMQREGQGDDAHRVPGSIDIGRACPALAIPAWPPKSGQETRRTNEHPIRPEYAADPPD